METMEEEGEDDGGGKRIEMGIVKVPVRSSQSGRTGWRKEGTTKGLAPVWSATTAFPAHCLPPPSSVQLSQQPASRASSLGLNLLSLPPYRVRVELSTYTAYTTRTTLLLLVTTCSISLVSLACTPRSRRLLRAALAIAVPSCRRLDMEHRDPRQPQP